MKRVFLIVLDSVGAGEAPDAADFGDKGTNTLRSISTSKYFKAENLLKMGFGNIDGLSFLGTTKAQTSCVARLTEQSRGKDTTIGHWEIAGIISDIPLPTFPNGFPDDVLDEFKAVTGRGVLCNLPYSGTAVIADFGKTHVETGNLIVYTSADSVFQIAAHEQVVPLEQLYGYCRAARKILQGKYGVGRVIARPFIGEYPNFRRTSNRHDFSLEPNGVTLLDAMKASGLDTVAVGKITDIFAARGVTKTILSHGNTEGMELTLKCLDTDFTGLCFVNLVDFDMLYGHRNDIDGYAAALAEFDGWLDTFLKKMNKDDVLIITADHGCDPGDISTDHTREYTPLIVYGNEIKPINLGTRNSFADIAATIAEWFNIHLETRGESFAGLITDLGGNYERN